MRSADCRWHAWVLVAVASGGTGCAMVSEPMKAMAQAVAPATGASAPAAGAGAAVSAQAPVSPEVRRAYFDAGAALRAGRTQEAERGFRALALAHPELGGPHANLGLIDRQAGKLTEAAAEFERALRLNPQQPVYLNQLGITYRQQGQFAKARAAYEQAIALDPNYAAPVLNLGILNDLYLGDGTQALALYGRYLALTPSGDAVVAKWVAELKNRKPAALAVNRKEPG